MASVNKVILIGNLGRDPEVRYTPSGSAVCNVSLATTRSWKDKATGEKKEETEWHRVVFYDRQAEIAGEYLKKGKPVYIEGRLKTRKWEKDGVDHYTTEIIAEVMQLLGGREDGAAPAPAPRPAAAPRPAPAPRPAAAPAPRAGGAAPGGFDDDSDIPFAFADYSAEPATSLHRRMRRYGF